MSFVGMCSRVGRMQPVISTRQCYLGSNGFVKLQSQAPWFQWFCFAFLDFARMASDRFELP